ncbi:accessory Sec system protein Asp3 [Streptococcus suis]|nr:accessory Sec system protein Asp3 [Streptococcus suis]
MKVRVKWKHFLRSAYSYGSDIRIEGNTIYFKNELMPPSFELKRWHSITNFQGKRIQPQLPLLKHGSSYRIEAQASVEPKDTMYIQVEFFNRYQEKIDFVILKDLASQFIYPKEAHFYEIALINAGCQQLTFEELILESLDEFPEEDAILFESLNAYAENSPLNIVLLENKQDFYMYKGVFREMVDTWKNLVLFEDSKVDLQDQKHLNYLKMLTEQADFSELRVLSYGPKGNQAARQYKEHHPAIHVYSVPENVQTTDWDEVAKESSSFAQRKLTKELKLVRSTIHPLFLLDLIDEEEVVD